jgi:hypothetical protein
MKEDGDRLLVGGRDVVDSVAKDIRPVSTLYTYLYTIHIGTYKRLHRIII